MLTSNYKVEVSHPIHNNKNTLESIISLFKCDWDYWES